MYEDVSVELWGKSVKAVQAAPQRWTGVVKPTRRLLETWPAVKVSVVGHRDDITKKYPATNENVKSAENKVDHLNRLSRNRNALMEHLALLDGIHSVILDAQYLHTPGGAHSHMLMLKERMTTFNKARPLSVLHYGEDGK